MTSFSFSWAKVESCVRNFSLAPTIVVFAIANLLSWFVISLGTVGRALKMTLFIAPIMIVAYLVALPYGPNGVAFAYSAVMMLWVVPVIAWFVHGTAVSFRDVLTAACKPLASGTVAGGLALGVRLAYGHLLSPFPRLLVECSVLRVAFFGMLLFVAGQKSFYLNLLGGLKGLRRLKGTV
jgi:PST family polysaccharide transporter